MILRRLSSSIRQQDWFTVLVEVLIVVVGVFLGIQVSNWNEGLADKRLGEVYVAQMAIELRRDLVATQELASYYGAVLDGVVETSRLLENENPDARALVLAAYRATEIVIVPSDSATWDQVVSSGHLDLLPSKVLGAGLVSYYSFAEVELDTTYKTLLESRYRELVRSIFPISVQMAIREGCSDVRDVPDYVSEFMGSCQIKVDAATLSSVSDALRSDPGIRKALHYQYSHVITAQNSYVGNLASIEKLLVALDSGVNK